MESKQEELEICIRLHDAKTAISETWWDSYHDSNVFMVGYVLFRKGQQGKVVVILSICESSWNILSSIQGREVEQVESL